MNKLKPYHIIPCSYIDEISSELYNFLEKETDVLNGATTGWIFLDTKSLMNKAPLLMKFFNENKLYMRHAAVTFLTEDFANHIDTKPVIAKVNIPIKNTEGWVNKWYEISDSDLAQCPIITDKFGQEVPDISGLPIESFKLVAEIDDMSQPMVFNSEIPHGVFKKTNAPVPRIIASFTFFNEPLAFLKN